MLMHFDIQKSTFNRSTETFDNHFAKKSKLKGSYEAPHFLKKGTILHQDLEEQEKDVFGHSQKVSVFHICGKNPLFATIFGVIIHKSWRFLRYLDIFPHGQ